MIIQEGGELEHCRQESLTDGNAGRTYRCVFGLLAGCKFWKHGLIFGEQRQTVVSQFFQMDRLVVEGGKSVWNLSES